MQVFGAMGVNMETARFFRNDFEETGAMENTVWKILIHERNFDQNQWKFYDFLRFSSKFAPFDCKICLKIEKTY